MIYLFLAVSLIGFVDATYLTVNHFAGESPTCSILEGCDKVTLSEFATVFGAPVALLGALYYLVIFLLSIFYLDQKNEKVLRYTAWFTIAGLLASAWFVYLQLFVIRSICIYCMASATTSTMLFLLGLFVLVWLNKTKETPEGI